jgi:Tfp pilus assembly protein PilF
LFFSASLRAEEKIPIDQVPMYGGMDRSTIPELKAADEKLIADTTNHYGTREKASTAFVNNGFAYYQRDDLANAMRRFNQAWLLNPQNPEVYAGFGSVLHDKGRNCEAMQMMEKAIALNPPTFQGIYPDAARIITLCAVSDKDLSAEAKLKLLERSESLYKKAEEIEPNKRYVYGSWATAYYWRGKYSDAWAMVTKERAAGGKPNEKFLELLREKMPEPASQ